MVKMTTIRFLLGIVVAQHLELIELDIKTTFLHGGLEEEIYMEQPKGFIKPDQERLVCRLKKSLYSLKQVHGNGTRSLTTLYNQSTLSRAMRTIVFCREQLKIDHPSSSSYTWMICFSLAEMWKSLSTLFDNYG